MKLVDVLLYDQVIGLDVNGPAEVFHAANFLLAGKGYTSAGYQLRFCAHEARSLRTSSGLRLTPDFVLQDLSRSDYLLVPGTVDPKNTIQNTSLVRALARAAQKTHSLVSVCTGSFLLAAAGLLDGRKATTHWSATEEMARTFPKVKVIPDAIFVRDGALATSAGVTAGIDLSLALVEEDFDAALAMEVARMLVVYRRRPGGQTQFSTPLALQSRLGARFAALYHWLSDNLQQVLSVEQLAQRMAMSSRHFSRTFTQETGMPPGRYVELLRLQRARELLECGQGSIARVADISGFGREERMRRAFVRELGVTPGLYQSHFAL